MYDTLTLWVKDNDKKYIVYSFICNNDGTRGFRFNILGLKGFTRFRRNWKNAWINTRKNKTNRKKSS